MAAGFEPDLVLHVGDYQYRENKCPVDIAGCVDAGWGYGWDTWDADLFTPGAALLAAAPWIMVRGNHEECARLDKAGTDSWIRSRTNQSELAMIPPMMPWPITTIPTLFRLARTRRSSCLTAPR